MFERKKLPIGISEFSKLRNYDFYYIDKTMLVAELLSNFSEVTLITRPRRFGKTLNMTMLREFFSKDVDSEEIFAGLKIMDTKYASELNKYPVLFFSFKDAKGDTALYIFGKIKREIYKEYKHYKFLANTPSIGEQEEFQTIFSALSPTNRSCFEEVDNALHFLSSIIYKYTNLRPILLIDEYDTPMISAYENNCYDELRSFFTNLFSSALKDNLHLNFGVMAGI